MNMHNPPHPGEFIKETYLDNCHISGRELAKHLEVAPSTLNRIIKGLSGISPEMAIRLSKVLGRSAKSWLSMQTNYDLYQAESNIDLNGLRRIELIAA